MFDHEKLQVYQRALRFVDFAHELLAKTQKNMAVHSQLDRASTSILLNIAEGNGKYTARDRCRFFDIARGSTLECAAILDVTVRRKAIEKAQSIKGKEILREIVAMLVGLIRSQNADRVYENACAYSSREQEKE